MKSVFIKCAALLSAISALSPLHAQLSSAQIASAPAEQVAGSSIFQFGSTAYFRALVKSQNCSAAHLDRASADETRSRAIAARLGTRLGAGTYDIDKPIARPAGGLWGSPCDGSTLGSYEMKIDELAAWADRADALNANPPRP